MTHNGPVWQDKKLILLSILTRHMGILLLQCEAEVARARLDLVLGLQVVHAIGGDSVDGQNNIAHGDLRLRRLPAVSQLKGTQKKHMLS